MNWSAIGAIFAILILLYTLWKDWPTIKTRLSFNSSDQLSSNSVDVKRIMLYLSLGCGFLVIVCFGVHIVNLEFFGSPIVSSLPLGCAFLFLGAGFPLFVLSTTENISLETIVFAMFAGVVCAGLGIAFILNGPLDRDILELYGG